MTNEELVEQIKKGVNKTEGMKQLYMQNMGFIAAVVRRYSYACQARYGCIPIIEPEELMHEAYFGLMSAAERYSPNQDAVFLTYAVHYIRQSVKRFLDNSGGVIRVPVHTQERIQKYNQVTAYYIREHGRVPGRQEYASWLGISAEEVSRLEKFMFEKAASSLDALLPSDKEESISLGDTIPAEVDIEEDTVERIAAAQISKELWELVAKVLKGEKKLEIFRLSYQEGLTPEQIARRLCTGREEIERTLQYGIRQLRSNKEARAFGQSLDLWEPDIPIDAGKIKRWAMNGRVNGLDEREFKYAVNMGWAEGSRAKRTVS